MAKASATWFNGFGSVSFIIDDAYKAQGISHRMQHITKEGCSGGNKGHGNRAFRKLGVL